MKKNNMLICPYHQRLKQKTKPKLLYQYLKQQKSIKID